jgi:hypothetical protein
MKVILCLFEQMSGLKINFHKSEIYCLGGGGDFERIFTCKSGLLPMKYLRVPINKKRLKNSDWEPTEGKMRNKLGPWQGKMLVMGGRVTLINSSLTSVLLYMLSFYRLFVGVREKLDKIMNNFLWDETGDKKKYHFVNWQTVCLRKDQGGLGILDLEKMNIVLLAKWLWKLFNEDGMWQAILRKKYLQKQTLC